MKELWWDLLVMAGVALPGVLICTTFWQTLRNFHRLLSPQRLRDVPWRGADVWFAFAVYLLLPTAMLPLLRWVGFFRIVYDRDLPLMDPRAAVWTMLLVLPLQLLGART